MDQNAFVYIMALPVAQAIAVDNCSNGNIINVDESDCDGNDNNSVDFPTCRYINNCQNDFELNNNKNNNNNNNNNKAINDINNMDSSLHFHANEQIHLDNPKTNEFLNDLNHTRIDNKTNVDKTGSVNEIIDNDSNANRYPIVPISLDAVSSKPLHPNEQTYGVSKQNANSQILKVIAENPPSTVLNKFLASDSASTNVKLPVEYFKPDFSTKQDEEKDLFPLGQGKLSQSSTDIKPAQYKAHALSGNYFSSFSSRKIFSTRDFPNGVLREASEPEDKSTRSQVVFELHKNIASPSNNCLFQGSTEMLNHQTQCKLENGFKSKQKSTTPAMGYGNVSEAGISPMFTDINVRKIAPSRNNVISNVQSVTNVVPSNCNQPNLLLENSPTLISCGIRSDDANTSGRPDLSEDDICNTTDHDINTKCPGATSSFSTASTSCSNCENEKKKGDVGSGISVQLGQSSLTTGAYRPRIATRSPGRTRDIIKDDSCRVVDEGGDVHMSTSLSNGCCSNNEHECNTGDYDSNKVEFMETEDIDDKSKVFIDPLLHSTLQRQSVASCLPETTACQEPVKALSNITTLFNDFRHTTFRDHVTDSESGLKSEHINNEIEKANIASLNSQIGSHYNATPTQQCSDRTEVTSQDNSIIHSLIPDSHNMKIGDHVGLRGDKRNGPDFQTHLSPTTIDSTWGDSDNQIVTNMEVSCQSNEIIDRRVDKITNQKSPNVQKESKNSVPLVGVSSTFSETPLVSFHSGSKSEVDSKYCNIANSASSSRSHAVSPESHPDHCLSSNSTGDAAKNISLQEISSMSPPFSQQTSQTQLNRDFHNSKGWSPPSSLEMLSHCASLNEGITWQSSSSRALGRESSTTISTSDSGHVVLSNDASPLSSASFSPISQPMSVDSSSSRSSPKHATSFSASLTFSSTSSVSTLSSSSATSLLSSINSSTPSMDTTTTTTTTTAGHSTTDAQVSMETGRRLRARKLRKFLPEKVRYKRQTLQTMTRPLKNWLYRHRDNPYPTKGDKLELVKISTMTLTQISNWFANARRRMKKTSRCEDMSWAKRIKEYNSLAEGNVELFSIPSDEETDEELDEVEEEKDQQKEQEQEHYFSPLERPNPQRQQSENLRQNCQSHFMSRDLERRHSFEPGRYGNTPTPSPSPTLTSPCRSDSHGRSLESPAPEEHPGSYPKYKHSMLQRYFHDASQHPTVPDDDMILRFRHRHLSSSTGSHDFECLSTSSVSSPSHEYHSDLFDEIPEDFENMAIRRKFSENGSNDSDDLYWKEIGAALALTSLAQAFKK